MPENPRRGRQARTFTTNVPKILDLKSSSEEMFSKNCRWMPLLLKLGDHHQCKAQQTTKSTGTLRHVYVFYRLLRQRLNIESCLTNLKRTNATESQSTVTGTVQTTYWLNQANLANYERTTGQLWVTDWWERGRWQISRKLSQRTQQNKPII